MTTLCRTYTSTQDAEDAIERLLSAAVPATRIELIAGHAAEDASDGPIGTFAGTTTADAETVGSYANIPRSGRDAAGSFAGNPDEQRRGSFGDTDHDTVVTYQRVVTHTRIATHHRLLEILVAAGLEHTTAAAQVGALHTGHVLVLIHGESTEDDIAAVIDSGDRDHSARPSPRAAA
jgi:hypothetical protein